MGLSREAILAVADLPIQVVAVPEWGGDVNVRGLSGLDRDELSKALRAPDGSTDANGYCEKLLVRTVVDDNGVRLFTDADITALAAKSATALKRVMDAAEKLNGLTANAVDVAVKN